MYGKSVKPDSYINRTYRVEAEIGSGGSGYVFMAWHTRLNKNVVIKVVENCSPEAIRIHRNEVEALKNIKSLHIPLVLDFFIENEKSFTIMEYINGVSFDKLLKFGRHFSEHQVINWYLQLASTLELIHGLEICHRDIKPANIMRTTTGDVCLIDFNSALVSGNYTGVISRSMGYASPEQYEYFKLCKKSHEENAAVFQENPNTALLTRDCMTIPASSVNITSCIETQRIDWKLSDIYSLGATIYHFLTRKRPPVTACEVEKITNLKGYSKGLLTVIYKSMQTEPYKRFLSAGELYNKLIDLL